MAVSRGSAVSIAVRAGLFLGLLMPAAPAAAEQVDNKTATANSSGMNPVLLELFTSEGCSSCPPADIYLQTLDTSQPIAGAQLIVLSEHVTYWDHDGWKDPNSSSLLTDRQSSYETALGVKTEYTPQVIVDGNQELPLGEQQKMRDFLQKAAAIPKVPVRIGEVTVDAGSPTVLRARIETDANFEKRDADMYVALVLDHVESQVLRGENGGRHLVHVAVVQQITKVGKLPKGKSFAGDVRLKLKPGVDPRNVRVIVFAQESGPGKVVGAALRKPTI